MSESLSWIWGRRPVLEAVRAGTARTVILATGRASSAVLDEIRALAGERQIVLREVPYSEVDRVAPGQNTQGVAAQVVERRLRSVTDLLSDPGASSRQAFLLVLDQIQDPHNLGALLRTANAAGVHGVILPERRSAPLSGTVAKVSAGATNYLPILEVANLARALDEVRRAGIWLVGLDGSAPHTLYSADLRMPLALILGSEGSGLRRLTRQHCDLLVQLPMLGEIESLNAAVAGSIAMYEVVRQRTAL